MKTIYEEKDEQKVEEEEERGREWEEEKEKEQKYVKKSKNWFHISFFF